MEMNIKTILAIIPLVLIQLIFIIICLKDWLKRDTFKGPGKWVWLIIFLFVNIIGPILYLTIGRTHDNN